MIDMFCNLFDFNGGISRDTAKRAAWLDFVDEIIDDDEYDDDEYDDENEVDDNEDDDDEDDEDDYDNNSREEEYK